MDRQATVGTRRDPLLRMFLSRYLPRIRRAFDPEEVWVFGSRIRGDAIEDSDLDVVVVASGFAGIPWPDRCARVLLRAGIRHAIEPLCYTPAEFREKRREFGIVRAAAEEGRRVFAKPTR